MKCFALGWALDSAVTDVFNQMVTLYQRIDAEPVLSITDDLNDIRKRISVVENIVQQSNGCIDDKTKETLLKIGQIDLNINTTDNIDVEKLEKNMEIIDNIANDISKKKLEDS
jgi:hypothetical protein